MRDAHELMMRLRFVLAPIPHHNIVICRTTCANLGTVEVGADGLVQPQEALQFVIVDCALYITRNGIKEPHALFEQRFVRLMCDSRVAGRLGSACAFERSTQSFRNTGSGTLNILISNFNCSFGTCTIVIQTSGISR